MKLIVVLLWSLMTSALCLAQEAPTSVDSQTISDGADLNQTVVPQFELADNPNMIQRIRDLLANNVTVLSQRQTDKINQAELRLLRFAARRQIASILATEGYFSPTIKFANEEVQAKTQVMLIHVNIDLGPPTHVSQVQLSFDGDAVPVELQDAIRAKWGLPVDQVFRDDEWSQAKANAIESLTEHGYAAAKISHSEAIVQDQQASLFVTLDSGPLFHIGELQVQGMYLYERKLLDSYHPPKKGDVYNLAALNKFQRGLQNSPYFSSVTVNIDPNPEYAAAVPVTVLLQERKKFDVGLAAGYSSNTGARGEISFQDRDFLFDAYNLKSAIRLEQFRQIAYADVFLPPKPSGYLDSVGVLFERSDIQGLLTETSSFGAKRVITENGIERRLGLSLVYEKSSVNGTPIDFANALYASIGRTWRNVDDTFNPRHGHIVQADVGGAAKVLLSDQNFVTLYGKYQQWIPVAQRDVLILRADAGYVISKDESGIPQDYLFRAGGTGAVGSVRGYAYQSLGVDQANGVVGGRVLTTASAEYVHYFGTKWGVAGFYDVGDAADRFKDLKINQGVGVGLRYRTPAGPIAVDLAYGIQERQIRLDFFLGVAF